MNSRQNLMKQIYETGFAIDEVKLFLNSHPTDRRLSPFTIRTSSSMRRPSTNLPSSSAR